MRSQKLEVPLQGCRDEGDWGLGIGDWGLGLGIGDWGLGNYHSIVKKGLGIGDWLAEEARGLALYS
ncbi:hypothetical protein H6F74_15675 [Trichocoleus sp. FACHB-90]|uniref:hypothetical protein n=1 Tax=Cyanophyceae TaxID=3028117 RepID=UPI00168474B5|nr:hypothetical protein [Trichocoleus sp. FACHB-90]MBD1927672.1 hypothetical protein [Trichocoleus sp. FACHB-90]